MGNSVKLTFRATVHRDGCESFITTVSGRPAWLLLHLLRAGNRGVTTLELIAARRVSHYLFMLRKTGIRVTTSYESHGGPFAGGHGRFTLQDQVTVSGGTLDAYLASPEGQREFGNASFARAA